MLFSSYAAKVAMEGGYFGDTTLNDTNLTVNIHPVDTACSSAGTSEKLFPLLLGKGTQEGRLHSDTVDIPPVVAIIGCDCTDPSIIASQLSSPLKVPMISPSATGSALSDKSTHPYFTRVVPPDAKQAEAFAALVRYLGDLSTGGWKRMTVLYVSRTSSVTLADAFVSDDALGNMTLIKEPVADFGQWREVADSDYFLLRDSLMRASEKKPFPRVFFMPASAQDIFLFSMMLEVGLFTADSALLTTESFMDAALAELPDVVAAHTAYQNNSGSVSDEEAAFFQSAFGKRDWTRVYDSLLGILGVRPQIEGPLAQTKSFRNFWTDLSPARMSDAGYPSDQTLEPSFFEVSTLLSTQSAVFMFDASLAMLLSITKLLADDVSPENIGGNKLLESILAVGFEGLTGQVQLDENGDRLGAYLIENIVGDTLIIIGGYSAMTAQLTIDTSPIFPSNLSVVPADRPAPCDPGFEATGDDCQVCSPGTYSPSAGSSCLAGPSGTFAAENQSSACTAAEQGMFVTDEGSTEASPCPVGQYSNSLGATSCLDCLPGFFTNDTGSTACSWCLEGTYSEGPGATDCDVCNSSLTTALAGSTSRAECICREGTYRPLATSGVPTADCLPCPSAMICELGSDMSQLSIDGGRYPKVQGGYMTLADDPLQPYKCVTESFCPGGDPGSCSNNRDGSKIACGLCSPSFYPDGDDCRPCSGGIDSALFALVVVALVLVLIGALIVIGRDSLQQTHSLIFSAICLGVLFTGLQTLGIFHHLTVAWVQPIQAAVEIAAIFSLDLNLLRTNCVLGSDPGGHFALRLLVFPLLVPIVGLITALRHPHLPFRLQFLNNLGTCLSFGFLSAVACCTLPFVCYSHPGVGLWSMRNTPSILCYRGSDFGAMAIFGAAVFSFVPLPFLCLSIQAVWMYPVLLRKMDSFDTLQGLRFLFVRFTPEAYYYAPIMLTRNMAVALVPVVCAQAAAQVLVLCTVLIVFLIPQARLCPWRGSFANIADVSITGFLVILLVSGGMLAEIERTDDAITILNVAIIVAFSSILIAAATYIIQLILARRVPFYSKFICHHKSAAAAQVRLLKINISVGPHSVFIDSEDLSGLDVIFDIVKTKVQTMVVYLTRDTLRRPWCAGEITTAYLASQAQVLVVRLPSFRSPTEEDMKDLPKYVDETGCSLKQYGISWDHVRTSFLKLFDPKQTPCINVINSAQSRLQYEHLAEAVKKGRGCKLFVKRTIVKDPPPTNLNQVVVSADAHDEEATAAVVICVSKIQERLFHKENRNVAVCSLLEKDEEDEEALAECFANSRAAIILLSERSLENRAQLAVIIGTTRLRAEMAQFRSSRDFSEISINIVPLALPGFAYPTERYYRRTLPLHVSENLEESEKYIRSLFLLSAISFPTHGTDASLEVQVDKIMDRIYKVAPLPLESKVRISQRDDPPVENGTGALGSTDEPAPATRNLSELPNMFQGIPAIQPNESTELPDICQISLARVVDGMSVRGPFDVVCMDLEGTAVEL